MDLAARLLQKANKIQELWNITGDFSPVGARLEKDGTTAIAILPELTLRVTLEKQDQVFVRRDVITNTASRPVTLYQALQRFCLDGGEAEIYTQLNLWETESLGGWQRLVTSAAAETDGVRHCHGATPMLALWYAQSGRGLSFHVLCDGAWRISARKTPVDGHTAGIFVDAGLHDGSFACTLQPGESLVLPVIVFYPFRNKTDLDCYRLHRWFLRQNAPRKMPVVYNTWLYQFDRFTYESIEKQVRAAADLGCEYFVIDAGWFGAGSSWTTCRGDWFERTQGGFGGRMQEMSALVRSSGMKFGIWFELELATPNALCVQEHPEYYIFDNGKCFLNFALHKAREAVLSMLEEKIEAYHLEYLKLDNNEDMDIPLTHDAFMAYHSGYLQVIATLREKHPDLYLLNCASGGFRMTLTQGRYFDSFWPTDNQNAYTTLRIYKDTLRRLPPQWMDTWLTISSIPDFPYNYASPAPADLTISTGDACWTELFSVKNSFLSALSICGGIGLSFDLTSLSPATYDFLKKEIAKHKENRAFYQTADCRILCDTETLTVLQYADASLSRCQLCLFTHDILQNSATLFPVVDENATYRVSDSEELLSGRDIAEYGLVLSLKERHEGRQLLLEKV